MSIDPATGQPLSPSGARPRTRAQKARPSGRARTARTSILPGDFLVSKGNDLGPGKAIEPGPDDTIVLEYFDHPGQTPKERHRENVARSQLKRFSIPSETRVYWEEPDQTPTWRSGRVQSVATDEQVEVKGYGDDYRFHDHRNLFIRWNRPLEDPSGFSRVGLFESPHNSERRTPVLRGISEQRAAARGMTGLLSTGVQLHDHQLIAARRVLEDHTQRYLLADEVGLGKTIEALLIVRQLMIDDPGLHVVVIAPPHLTGQWESEIETKLFPSHFPLTTIDVYSYTEAEAWTPADMLIIDEAHNLVSSGAHETLRELAESSPRLLLLSATPALHNERDFLAMLQLLDPHVYREMTVGELIERLTARQALGRALVGLRPDAPSFVLNGALTALREVLKGEDDLLKRLDAVESSVGEDREDAITTFRGLVADAYQVHRRMIRSRRTDRLAEVFPVAGRTGGIERLDLDDDAWSVVSQSTEQARELLAIAVETGELDESEAARFLSSIVSVAPDVRAMHAAARHTPASDAIPDANEEELVPAIVDALTGEVVAGESIVVFNPTAHMASAVAAELHDLLGGQGGLVTTLVDGLDGETVRSRIDAFSAPKQPSDGRHGLETRWIICDRSAEEGANLQAADLLVHIGLPAEVNELEQRIGRVDRWSTRRTPWRAIEVLPGDGLLGRWSSVVRDGFAVHSKSLASLQRAIEKVSTKALGQLLDPSRDVGNVCADVRAALEREREAVREQDAVDVLTLGEHDLDFSRRLREADERTDEEFPQAFQDLMSDAMGNLRFRRSGELTKAVASFTADDPASPKRHAPLVPLRRVMTDFLPSLGNPHAGRRDVCVAQGVPPLRTGAPLVDAVESFLRHDDRGRAWGIWRWDSTQATTTDIWWRVDLLVRAAIGELPEGADHAVVQRRLDTALPPRVETVWVKYGEVETPDDATRDRLERPYDTRMGDAVAGRDFNLSPRRAYALIERCEEPFGDVVGQTVDIALGHVMSTPQVAESTGTAMGQLSVESERRCAVLERRRAASRAEARAIKAELELEHALLELMQAAVRTPNVSLDALGVVVLSGENPFEQSDE